MESDNDRDELQLEGWDFEVEVCEHDDYCYCSPWYCGCDATPNGQHDPVEEEEEDLPKWMLETCEHGLSAWLCSGPMHYSDEF